MGMDDSLKQRIAIYTQGLRGVSICDQKIDRILPPQRNGGINLCLVLIEDSNSFGIEALL